MPTGSGGSGEVSKMLAGNLYGAPRSWSFPYTRPGTENGIMAMQSFGGYLYAFQNSLGIIHRLEDSGWVTKYTETPLVYPYDLAYGQGVFTIGTGSATVERMYMGHVYTIDGKTYAKVTGLDGVGYVNDYEEVGGKLYAVTSASNNLYVSDDGVSFKIFWTAPAGVTTLRCLRRYYSLLFMGGYSPGAAPIYFLDPNMGTVSLGVTTTADEIQYMASIQGALLAFNKQTGIYVFGMEGYTTLWLNRMIDMPIQNMFSTAKWRGQLIVPGGHRDGDNLYALSRGGYINGGTSGIRLKVTRIASVMGAVVACVHDGKLYISSETPNGTGDVDAHIIEFNELDMRPTPAEYEMWRSQSVLVAGLTTLGYPTISGKKTFSLLSTQSGAMDIEVDFSGDGTFRTLEAGIPIIANTIKICVSYSNFCWARIRFVPAVNATVSAWLQTSGED